MPVTQARGRSLASSRPSAWVWLFAGMSLLWAAAAQAKTVGKTITANGLAVVQRVDGGVRVLARGTPIDEGDVITTGEGFVVIELADETRMTLRSHTAFTVEELSYGEGHDRALMRLYQGGMRAQTGLLDKSDAEAYEVKTPDGTLFIHGTDFEARLCGSQCAQEGNAANKLRAKSARPVVARVAFLRSRATAAGRGGRTRTLALGGSLFERETVQTFVRSIVVLAFRDKSRVSLQADTSLAIDRHQHDASTPERSRAQYRLLRGGMRLLAGLLEKRHPEGGVEVTTAAGVVRVRGGGVDVQCKGECASKEVSLFGPVPGTRSVLAALLDAVVRPARAQTTDGLYASVWAQGDISFVNDAGSARMGLGETIFISDRRFAPSVLARVPTFLQRNAAPRPDLSESVDTRLQGQDLFGAVEQEQPQPGLYVRVFAGDVTLADTRGRRVEVGPGETGFVDPGRVQAERIIELRPFAITPPPDVLDDARLDQSFQPVADAATAGGELECVVQ